MAIAQVDLPIQAIAEVCRRNHVLELGLFGSAAKGGFRPESDLDFIVEFDSGAQVGFLTLARVQRELSILIGRRVDLVPKAGLKPKIREEILSSLRIVYAA